MLTSVRRFPALSIGIVIAAVMAAGDMASGAGPLRASITLAIVLGYAVVVTLLGRRSEMVSALAGRPVDERWEHIGVEATAAAFGVSALVVLAAFVVAQASHADPLPYGMVAAVMGLSYIGSVIVLRVRH